MRLTALVLALVASFVPNRSSGEEPVSRGRLSVLIFDEQTHQPVAGLVLRLDGAAVATTDRDGAASIMLEPGEHVLEIDGDRGARLQPIRIAAGEETEALLRIRQSGALSELLLEETATPTVAGPGDRRAIFGWVRGVVTDGETRSPVAGARVLGRGAADVRTGAGGEFELELETGDHAVTVIHPKYSTASSAVVKVRAEQVAEVKIELLPAVRDLGEFVVLAPRITGGTASLLEERRSATQIADLVGAEAISKSGDSDAAGALGRVTGITVVGGRYIYVRGLGERYSSTLLDGSVLPSPEPEGRVVPLDMFPANMLDSLLVEKTYSVDRPGEFGGGTVILRTRELPKSFTGELGLSLGAVSGVTFQQGLGGPVSGTDFLGFGAGARDLPELVRDASEASPLREGDLFSSRGYSKEDLERFGEALPSTFGLTSRRVLPDLALNASIGGPLRLLDRPGGFSLGLVYKNEWDCCDRRVEQLNSEAYDFQELDDEITLGGLLTFGVDFSSREKIRYTGLVSRISNHHTSIQQGYDPEIAAQKRIYALSWEERMLVTQQLRGAHPLNGGDRRLEWRYMFSFATLDEPDRRQLRYDQEGGTDVWRMSLLPEGNLRVFTELFDTGHDAGVSFSLPLAGGKLVRRLEVGIDGSIKDRTVQSRRYKFKAVGAQAGQLLALGPDEIFAAENIGRDGFLLEELSRPNDTYRGDQQVGGAFAQVQWSFTERLSLTAGARGELSRQHVETFDPFNPDLEARTAALSTFDLLPAATLSWEVAPDMFLRSGASRTVSRPNFRELSPARLQERSGEPEVEGNPELQRALITHADLRWEWYPALGETLSAGVFVKVFDDPIEQSVIAGADEVHTFRNAEGAVSLGAELEARKSFGFLSAALEDLYVAANATFVHSRVELTAGGIETSKARALQGQSPYVLNVQAGWDGVESGTSLVALYNVQGRRIAAVGSQGNPDRYEAPFHQVDLIFSQELGPGLKLALKAKNLLDPEVVHLEGERRAEVYRRGRAFTVGISGKF